MSGPGSAQLGSDQFVSALLGSARFASALRFGSANVCSVRFGFFFGSVRFGLGTDQRLGTAESGSARIGSPRVFSAGINNKI